MTRYFILTGAPTPAALLDRAEAHGTAGRAVAHATPHPVGCYGAVEITYLAGAPVADDEGAVGVGAFRPAGTVAAPGEPQGSAT